MDKTVAIHQPDFFPWLGFFNKYIMADIFVIADSVQFPKSKGNLTNRVAIIHNKQKIWWTKPIDRSFTGIKRVGEILSPYDKEWSRKSLKSIQMDYGRAPYFSEIYPFLEPLINYQADNLMEYNMNSIEAIFDILGIDKNKIVYQSSLDLDEYWKIDLNEYIIKMVRKLGCTSYLSGDGSSNYQNESIFQNQNIAINYTKYIHPQYSQFNTSEFVPGLTIIDALMNTGVDGVKRLLKNEK